MSSGSGVPCEAGDVETDGEGDERVHEETESVTTAGGAGGAGVEPETGRPRSSAVIGGRRSPHEDELSSKAGTLSPEAAPQNAGRTGKKLSQWGASARRSSYWKRRDY
jgi:hypothetical protein